MRASSRQHLRRCAALLACAAAVASAVTAVLPAIAAADDAPPRSATVRSGPAPSLVYDLTAAHAALDPVLGTLTVTLDLRTPLPPGPPPADSLVELSTAAAAEPLPGDPTGDLCRPLAVSAGDATVTFTPPAVASAGTELRGDGAPEGPGGSGEPDEPTAPADVAATAAIVPDPLPRTLTTELSAARDRLTATVSDPLLIGAAPRCLRVRIHGRVADAPDTLPDEAELSAWFDGERPLPPPAGEPREDPPAHGPPPAPAPSAPSDAPTLPACDRSRPAGLTWGDFPRELAVGGSALVPVQARSGRDVRDVVASLTTIANGRRLGPPVLVALPPRGYALKLQAPAVAGRLDAQLSWLERRGGASCSGRSRGFRIAVVAPRAPRLTVGGSARRLTLSWGLPRRDCHALLARGLRLRLEGFGQRRDYRVATPCDGWDDPGAALPDIAVQRDGERLLLAPLGDAPGLWEYRLSAVAGGRTLLRGSLLIEVSERGDTLVRTIRLRRG